MPELGEIRAARDVGYKTNLGKVIWHACEVCGKTRWTQFVAGKPQRTKCHYCAAPKWPDMTKHPSWKGGRHKKIEGYVLIKLPPGDFFLSMVDRRRYVFEHRLVMAKHLGRCLQPWELIHHKNGIRDDNRLKNLELTTLGNHTLQHNKGYRDGYQQGFNDGQNTQIQELQKEIKLLQWQLNQLRLERV